MFYMIADPEWCPGRPSTPSMARTGLFRTRAEALRLAAGRPVLAAALHYDPIRGLAVPAQPASYVAALGWSAQAFRNDGGGVTVLAPIPAELLRVVGPARLRLHAGQACAVQGPHRRVGPSHASR